MSIMVDSLTRIFARLYNVLLPRRTNDRQETSFTLDFLGVQLFHGTPEILRLGN